jgi:cytochrome d ubiquinol oxidase subunit II
MLDLDNPAIWLPVVFAGLMAFSILLYVILDGYDLGVGLLLPGAHDEERDVMIASIGPFWDANETWLVLGIGLLLVAFPAAHGMILSTLYLPVALMLIGLILRGVAFELRVKGDPSHKGTWDAIFFAGSLTAALAQGWMLGSYIMGLGHSLPALLFSGGAAIGLAAGYMFIGACWLVLKTEGDLQHRAAVWARAGLIATAISVIAVSIATPLASERVAERWFALPNILGLAPIPIATVLLFVAIDAVLRRIPLAGLELDWFPFAGAVGIFALSFAGIAYSFYPYVVLDRLTIYEAASAPDSLVIILIGTLIVLPVIGGYTIFAYRVFRGKAGELRYE